MVEGASFRRRRVGLPPPPLVARVEDDADDQADNAGDRDGADHVVDLRRHQQDDRQEEHGRQADAHPGDRPAEAGAGLNDGGAQHGLGRLGQHAGIASSRPDGHGHGEDGEDEGRQRVRPGQAPEEEDPADDAEDGDGAADLAEEIPSRQPVATAQLADQAGVERRLGRGGVRPGARQVGPVVGRIGVVVLGHGRTSGSSASRSACLARVRRMETALALRPRIAAISAGAKPSRVSRAAGAATGAGRGRRHRGVRAGRGSRRSRAGSGRRWARPR